MDGLVLKAFVESRKLNKTKLATALGMSKQNLYQLFESKEFNLKTVESLENHFKTKWDRVKATVNIDFSREKKPAKALKRRAAVNSEVGKDSEKEIMRYARKNQALLKTVVEYLGEIHAKMEKRKPEEVRAEMNNRVVRHLQALRKGGK